MMRAGLRALLLGAAAWAMPSAAAAALVLISTSDEARIGAQMQAAMRAQTARLHDAPLEKYVGTIGHRLARAAHGPAFAYTFDLADTDVVNAYALPGGHVWVNRGVLALARTESELAGVVAHEVAHVVERHVARQASNAMVANIGLELLGALLGNTGGAFTSGLAANVMTGSVFLGFSRADELAADRRGTRILSEAGWDPRGLAMFLESARAASRRNPSPLQVLFSNHPATEDRLAALAVQTKGTPHQLRDTREFGRMKSRLATFPHHR
jgi:predicted Zn-dependent protease